MGTSAGSRKAKQTSTRSSSRDRDFASMLDVRRSTLRSFLGTRPHSRRRRVQRTSCWTANPRKRTIRSRRDVNRVTMFVPQMRAVVFCALRMLRISQRHNARRHSLLLRALTRNVYLHSRKIRAEASPWLGMIAACGQNKRVQQGRSGALGSAAISSLLFFPQMDRFQSAGAVALAGACRFSQFCSTISVRFAHTLPTRFTIKHEEGGRRDRSSKESVRRIEEANEQEKFKQCHWTYKEKREGARYGAQADG